MDLHLLLHLLHHLLHAHCLPFIFSVDLLFDVLLDIHVVEGALYRHHALELVHSFPELFERMIFD